MAMAARPAGSFAQTGMSLLLAVVPLPSTSVAERAQETGRAAALAAAAVAVVGAAAAGTAPGLAHSATSARTSAQDVPRAGHPHS
jgi:hypothetical protein